ncbi:MAG: hypothetical protein ACTSRG_27265, partial [Candidatus Helarchaeota archaeon]
KEMMSESGNVSVTRFVFLVGTLWVMAFVTILAITTDVSAAEIVAVFAGIWGPVAALKFGQKFQEKK